MDEGIASHPIVPHLSSHGSANPVPSRRRSCWFTVLPAGSIHLGMAQGNASVVRWAARPMIFPIFVERAEQPREALEGVAGLKENETCTKPPLSYRCCG
jgi:hypothetical protein